MNFKIKSCDFLTLENANQFSYVYQLSFSQRLCISVNLFVFYPSMLFLVTFTHFSIIYLPLAYILNLFINFL